MTGTEQTALAVGVDKLTLRLVEFLFPSHGYQVLVTPHLTPAPPPGLEHDPDLVLLDTNLRDDGLAAVRAIKRERAHLPVIVLTVHTKPGDIVRALDAGADEYVTKPFDPAELVARSEAVLRRYRTVAT